MLFDLIVIGSGPGGQRAAIQAAKAGKKVALIEEHSTVGGWCVNAGTLPSKSFRESVYRWSLSSKGSLAQGQDVTATATSPARTARDLPDMCRLLERRDRVVASESVVILDQIKRNGIKIYHGVGKFVSANDVEVHSEKGIEKLTGEFIVIATGARPVAPKHLAINGKTILDSNCILEMKSVPKTLVVLGGGIIGCEYASMFATAGTKVYLVDRRHEILASVDREVVNHLMERFESQGMEIILEAEAKKVTESSKGMEVELSNGRKLECNVVLVALGRSGNIEKLGLEASGVKANERGLIPVDTTFRTNVPNIYAVGDVVGAPALASTSLEQGRIAVCHAFGLDLGAKLAQFFPYGIYTIPEISMIGPTEEDLVAGKVEYVVGRAYYKELARGQIVGDRWGLLKLLVDRKSLQILGVHIIGDAAANLIHTGQAVMHFGGDVNYFIGAVFNYPTLAEAYKTAAFHAVNQLKGTDWRNKGRPQE